MSNSKLNQRILEELAFGDLVPDGSVTVELFNERGKLRDRETKHNFIGKAWKLHARAVLRQRWARFGYNPNLTGQFSATTMGQLWGPGRHAMPKLANDAICLWNQTTAEDSVNEESPVIPPAGIIAYATRYPFASPTGARGNVNLTESDITDTRARFVFDWTTGQGNGTFQSVGWLPMAYPGFMNAHVGKGYRRRFQTAAVTLTQFIAGTTSGYYASSGYVDPSTGKYYFLVERYNQSKGAMRVLSVDFSGLNDSNDTGMGVGPDVNNMAITLESDEFTPTSSLTTSGASAGLKVIGRDGTNTIFTYQTSTNNESQPNNARWGKVGASGASTTYAVSGSRSGFLCGAVLGGYAYLGNSYAAFDIQKYNISTGALDSTITLDAATTAACTAVGITTPRIEDMVTDGTDLYLVINNQLSSTTRVIMLKVNTSGALLEIIGTIPGYQSSGNPTESAGSPYNQGTGTAVWLINHLWEPSQESFYGSQTAANVFDSATAFPSGSYDSYIVPAVRYSTGTYTHHWVWYDGAPYYISNLSGFHVSRDGTTALMFMWHAYRRGMDLGSRVLLGTSKTKLNTETMKVTYDVTFPGLTS